MADGTNSIARALFERNSIELRKAEAMEKMANGYRDIAAALAGQVVAIHEINATFEMIGGILADATDKVNSMEAVLSRDATLGEDDIEPMGPADV